MSTAGSRTEATDAVTDAALVLTDAALAVAPVEELFELPELFEEPPEALPVEVPSSTSVRLSSAAVRLAFASSSVSCAEDGSSVAISCPFLTC